MTSPSVDALILARALSASRSMAPGPTGSVLVSACLIRCSGHLGKEAAMRQVKIGDVTIDAVIEREGPWRRPQDFFPAYDEAIFKEHLKTMEPEVFDAATGLMVITYQTFVVR